MIQANIELRNTSEDLREVVEMKKNLVPPTGVEQCLNALFLAYFRIFQSRKHAYFR